MLRASSKRGITILEMLLVAALLSIFAAALIPSASPSVHRQLHTAGEWLQADLAYCRSLAITRGSPHRLTFLISENIYVLEHSGVDSAHDRLPAPHFQFVADPPHRRTTPLEMIPSTGGGVRLLSVQAIDEHGSRTIQEVEFGPLGQTTRPETILIRLSAGTGADRRNLSVGIHPVTGLTTLENYSVVENREF